MPTPRVGSAVARGSDGRIYAFGGRIYPTFVGTVEAYDPCTDEWTSVKSLPTTR
jgi:hypothetical protein